MSEPRFNVDPRARYEVPEKPLTDKEAHRLIELAEAVKAGKVWRVSVECVKGELRVYPLDRAA